MNSPRKKEKETVEHPFRGRVTIYQPAKGFRYSVDAFLLVNFASRLICDEKATGVLIAELGSGAGVVSLGLALYPAVNKVVGIEIVPELAQMSNRSAQASGLADKVEFIAGDLKDPQKAGMKYGSFDVVVSNPPYRKVGKGRVSEDFARAVARHEIAANIADVVRSASRLLKSGGAFCLVYVPERLPELLVKLEAEGLNPHRLRFAHPHLSDPAKMALVEARKNFVGNLVVESPLFLQDEFGKYTKEVEATFEGPP